MDNVINLELKRSERQHRQREEEDRRRQQEEDRRRMNLLLAEFRL